MSEPAARLETDYPVLADTQDQRALLWQGAGSNGAGGLKSQAPRRSKFAQQALSDATASFVSMIVIAIFALTFIAQPFRIPSASMEPTLLVGDFLLVDKMIVMPAASGTVWSRLTGQLLPYRRIEDGDVIVFRYPPDPNIHVVKRVIGVPGDRIRIDDGMLYRNGHAQVEGYALDAAPGAILEGANAGAGGQQAVRDQFPPSIYTDPGMDPRWWIALRRDVQNGEYVVPARSYFVLGDNRGKSRDSRYWGLVPGQNIVGSPLLIYYSLREAAASDAPIATNGKLESWKQAGEALVKFARRHRIFHVVR